MYLFRPRDIHSFESSSPEGLKLINVAMPVSVWQRFATLAGLDSGWAESEVPPMVLFEPGAPSVMGPLETAVELFRSGSATMLDLMRFWSDIIPILLPRQKRGEPGFGAPRWLARALDPMLEEEHLRGGVPNWSNLTR